MAANELEPWLTLVVDPEGREHAVLSDGWRHIRIDVRHGTLASGEAVLLEYHLQGIKRAGPQIVSLRRFLALARHHRFARGLFPPDPKIARWLTMLRVHDARAAGASYREIAAVLFGEARTADPLDRHSDSIRSRVRRLARDAAAMARGGYLRLLGGRREDRRS